MKKDPAKTQNDTSTRLPYRDPSLPVKDRVADLMNRMTLEEKIGQMNQLPIFAPLKKAICEEGLGSILCGVDDDIEELMHLAVEKTRLGIPLLVGIDAIHGHSMQYNATIFPSQLGMSCSWDEKLCQSVARATAEEMAHTGCAWTFSPVFCMARDLRWGRVDETFGEDPLLIGTLGSAMIRGYQGDDLADPNSIAACAKHYAGYGESVGGRDACESEYSRRKLEALYLPPFEMAAKAGAATFMTAYHAIDGVTCSFNKWLLTDVLRDRWGSDALLVTDWCNFGFAVNSHHTAASDSEAVEKGLNAGNDMSMSFFPFFETTLAAVKNGKIPLSVVDAHVRRILTLKFRLGLFENPRYPSAAGRAKTIGTKAHHQLALEAARKSAVLLKNDDMLPLRMDVVRTIAVVGPVADDDLVQLGDWSLGAGQKQGVMERNSRRCTKTVLDGILSEFGEEAKITYAKGAGLAEPRPERIARAVRLAEEADVVVLVLSDNFARAGECRSIATLELTEDQQALVDALAKTGTPIVGVFLASKPLVLTKIVPKLDALICTFNPGMEGGQAIAEILRGKVNPTGRLSISFPAHVGQQPCAYDQMPGAHQEHYADLLGLGFAGLFPFGFGLSYNTCKYFPPKTDKTEYERDEPVRLSVDVRNTGDYDGVETVQVYFHDVASSVTQPVKRLVAFQRVPLKSGEKKTVTFEIPAEKFTLIDADCKRVFEPGEFDLMVGPSSATVQTVRVTYR